MSTKSNVIGNTDSGIIITRANDTVIRVRPTPNWEARKGSYNRTYSRNKAGYRAGLNRILVIV